MYYHKDYFRTVSWLRCCGNYNGSAVKRINLLHQIKLFVCLLVDMQVFKLTLGLDDTTRIQIWDTSYRLLNYQKLLMAYTRGAHAVVVVYDITNKVMINYSTLSYFILWLFVFYSVLCNLLHSVFKKNMVCAPFRS